MITDPDGKPYAHNAEQAEAAKAALQAWDGLVGPTMKIRITLNSAHPHFGGHEITTWDYDMAEGEKAAAHYRKLKQEIGTSGYATAKIAVVHLG